MTKIELPAMFLLVGVMVSVGMTSAAKPLSPILLVNGDGGTQVYAKLNKTSSVHYLCWKKHDWFLLWLNLEELIRTYAMDCFVDNMKLVYDNVTRTTDNTPGVQTEIRNWGNTTSMEYLDPNSFIKSVGEYFYTIAQTATTWGYKRGKDLVGAAFDFRKAPNEFGEYYQKLKNLIETTYYNNQNTKVTIVAHSMGNPVMLYFYNNQPQKWKDKFLNAHVSLSGPWGGSLKIMLVFASGYNLDHWATLVPPLKIRKEQRSMPSSAFLIPSNKFWNEKEVLVQTPTKNYTVNNYQEFFTDIQYETGYEMYKDTKDLVRELKPPGVQMHCLYGTGVPTPSKFTYAKGYFPDYQPTFSYGDGDGTVNLRSLLGCSYWVGHQKQKVYMREFPKNEHVELMFNKDMISYLKKVVSFTFQ